MDCRDKTAFCGLYCGDCIPGDTRIYEAIDRLLAVLDGVGMAHYAAFKAAKNPLYAQYDTCISVLKELKRLQCSGSCRRGPVSELGCAPDCAIRACVLDRGYEGCWECEERVKCAKLDGLKGFHPCIVQTLDTIAAEGIEGWVTHRPPHYPWSEKE